MGSCSSQGTTLVGATRAPHCGRAMALSTAYGSLPRQFGGVLPSLPGSFAACGTRCVFTAHGTKRPQPYAPVPSQIGRVAVAGTLYISVYDATQCNFAKPQGRIIYA